jgi:hypothetical protein
MIPCTTASVFRSTLRFVSLLSRSRICCGRTSHLLVISSRIRSGRDRAAGVLLETIDPHACRCSVPLLMLQPPTYQPVRVTKLSVHRICGHTDPSWLCRYPLGRRDPGARRLTSGELALAKLWRGRCRRYEWCQTADRGHEGVSAGEKTCYYGAPLDLCIVGAIVVRNSPSRASADRDLLAWFDGK